MTVSMLLGAPAEAKIPITAIGSVGEMSAPNNKHQIKGKPKPNKGSIKYKAIAMSAADTIVPIPASTPIGSL